METLFYIFVCIEREKEKTIQKESEKNRERERKRDKDKERKSEKDMKREREKIEFTNRGNTKKERKR